MYHPGYICGFHMDVTAIEQMWCRGTTVLLTLDRDVIENTHITIKTADIIVLLIIKISLFL